MFEQAVVFEIGGDACRAEGMAASTCTKPGFKHLALDHPVDILLVKRTANTRLPAARAEQEALRLHGNAGNGDIFVEILLQSVMAGHLVLLAALLVQPHPTPAPLCVIVLHLLADDSIDAGEGVDHDADQSTVAEALERVGVDGIE